jgi:DNA-binding MarR family transcriptional regulator
LNLPDREERGPMKDATLPKPAGDEAAVANLKAQFIDCLRLVERMHRRMLDVIKVELDQNGVVDINSVQALLLYNVGEQEVTAGELRSRGYYMGSNVSYNLKKLVETGYIEHERAKHDRRAVRVRLSQKGQAISQLLDQMFEDQTVESADRQAISTQSLADAIKALRSIERFWAEKVRFVEF